MPGQNETRQTQQQQSVSQPWQPAQPLLQDILQRYGSMNPDVTAQQTSALSNLNAATGNIPNFGASSADALRNMFSTTTAPQVGMLSNAFNTLQGNLGSTASGANLDPYSTPGFGTALDTMAQDITNRTKGVYAASGRDPSGAGSFAQSLGRGLSQGLAPTLANQYNTNYANMLGANNALFTGAGSTATGITGQQQVPLANAAQALGLIPGVTGAYTAPAGAQLGAATAQYQQPWTNLSALLNPVAGIAGLGGQTNQAGTSQTVQPQSTLGNVVGAGMGGAGILSLLGFSDERVKDEVKQVGKLDDGQKVYRFRYKGDPQMRIGLLAQEVAKHEPSAVHNVGGILAVDHRRATERAAQMRGSA